MTAAWLPFPAPLHRLVPLTGVLVLLLPASGVAQSGSGALGHAATDRNVAEIGAAIDAYAAALADAGQLAGTILVELDGRTIYERAFGMADYEIGVANTVATRHGVASVTKLLTAILTLKLVEDGVLGLHDPLSSFVPDFPRGDEITVDHLLHHRSGIPHRVLPEGDVSRPRSASDMVEAASAAELLFPPGSARAYSSAGYAVLAAALEHATGRSYPRLLEAEVLRPAGALHAVSDDGWTLLRGRSKGHLLGGTGPVPARPADPSSLVGGGSVFATPRDLLLVLRALDRGELGQRARSEILGEDGTVSWNGQTLGYRSFVEYDAKGGPVVIFAGNLLTGAGDLLRRDLPRIAAGDEVPPPSPLALPVRGRREAESGLPGGLPGVYQFRAGESDSEEELRFSPDGSHAVLGSWVLVPMGGDTLLSTTDYATLEVVREDGGGIAGLEWTRGDDSFFLPRVRGLP